MKKVLFGLITLVLINSCGPEIIDNRRQYFEATIVDAMGNPISNQQVRISTISDPDDRPLRTSFLDLAVGTTDELGFISLNSLTANRNIGVELRNNSSELRTLLIPQERWNNNDAVIIPELVVKENTIVTLEFINTSGIMGEFLVNIDYHNQFCIEEFVDNNFQVEVSCQTESRSINNGNTDMFQLPVMFPSVVQVEYSINGITYNESFSINSPNESYVVNY